MRPALALLLSWPLTLGLLLTLPPPSAAQYMYLDTNDDGVWTVEDVLAPGGQTDVDVWLITDQNRDGSGVVCSTNDGQMTINSYGIYLRAAAGTIAWGAFVNRVPEFESLHWGASTSTEYFVAHLSGSILPPGRYLLGTLTVAVATGTPALSFVTQGRIDRQNAGTWFGCMCLGPDLDNTLKLGKAWSDVDGLAYGGPNNAPILAQPSDMVLNEGMEATQELTATDPEGSAVLFALVAGPAFAFVTTQSSSQTGAVGRVVIHPGFSDRGTYQVTIGATDGALVASRSFTANVLDVQLAPRFEFSSGHIFCVERGYPSEFAIKATDPDNDMLRFEASALPVWAQFVDMGDNSARLTLSPPDDETPGETAVVFRATDGAFVASLESVISVRESFYCIPASSPFQSGGPPRADAGGPYAAVAGEAVRMDGGASYDPDGSALAYAWNLGDGTSATGRLVSHAYEHGGEYKAVLRVTSEGLAGRDTARAEVAPPHAARAFTSPGFEVIPLRSGRAAFCVRMEAVTSDYSVEDILPASARLYSEGTGEVEEIAPVAGKGRFLGDSDRNGLPELNLCFAWEDLGRLFSGVRAKRSVACVVRGRLSSGAKVEAPISLTVIGEPPSRLASVSPNPLNPTGALAFEIRRSGAVRVRLFDLGGRLVRTLLDRPLPAGSYSVSIDGRNQTGNAMASGIYFFRIETIDGVESGRFTVLK